MKVSAIRRETSPGGERVAADVSWEDSDRPARRIFFEVPAEFAEGLSTEPEAFALGCAVPAMNHGERRLTIEGALCPRVREGLHALSVLLRDWYGDGVTALTVDAAGGFRPKPAAPPRSALFLSGGIDSLFTLVSNRADFPLDHPASFRDALVVKGFSFFPPDTAQAGDVWRRSWAAVRTLSAEAGVSAIPVTSNLRELEPDFMMFASRYFGVMLAAVGHALARRVTNVSVGSDMHLTQLFPWGAHPLVFPMVCSSAVEIVESGGGRTRLEKTRFLAGHPGMLDALTVCPEGPFPDDALNCGRCEKCVRTLLSLMIAGVPESGRRSFAVRSVDVATIDRLGSIATPAIPYYWNELAAILDATGRPDLAEAGRRLLERSRRASIWHADAGWRGRARRVDRRCFGGALLRASRGIRSLRGRARGLLP